MVKWLKIWLCHDLWSNFCPCLDKLNPVKWLYYQKYPNQITLNLKLSFTNIWGLNSNFVTSKSFFESNFKKILTFICSVMLFSSEIAYYLHNNEYCYDSWVGVACLEPLADCQNVASYGDRKEFFWIRIQLEYLFSFKYFVCSFNKSWFWQQMNHIFYLIKLYISKLMEWPWDYPLDLPWPMYF